jgi:hypothetical protein
MKIEYRRVAPLALALASTHGAAHAAELAGDIAKAKAQYARLLTQVGSAEGRREIERARSLSRER